MPTTDAAGHHLPSAWYGGFDLTFTPDGGKRYRLPHTLGATALVVTTSFWALMGLGAASVALAHVHPILTPNRALPDLLANAALLLCPLHAVMALAVALFCAVTGWRSGVVIAINPHELIYQDRVRFPATDLWMISYGFLSAQGTAAETFKPKVEIQIGTTMITLAEHIEPVAGRLFMRLFQEDTRRYWHGHN